MNLAFYTRYAFRALLRDGQRTLLAILCIAFGVMSLVALQLLSKMIHDSVVTDPRASLGGDLLFGMEREGRLPLTSQQLSDVENMKATGVFEAYTLEARGMGRYLKMPGTGRIDILTGGSLGVDPSTYPLLGQIHLREPAGGRFSDIIGKPLDTVVTSDLADKYNLKIGSTFLLLGNPSSSPKELRVGGIADQVPGSGGDTIYYSLQTASRLNGLPMPANFVAATLVQGTTGGRTRVAEQLSSSGWSVLTADDVAKDGANVANLFGFMLKGAGILGLFVGGIGVANTLQVLLARRTLEIATLKTLGYKRRDLLFLFGIETALLGIVGGFIGVLVALGLSFGLMTLFSRIGATLLTYNADPLIIAEGVLIGVVTAVIFGLYTIVRASSVRPATLLRDLPATRSWSVRVSGFALLLVLLVVVTAISVLIMGSVADGVYVIAGALGGLLALTLAFGGTLLAALSIPTRGFALVTMARRNLKRQPMRAIFALIALFAGVLAIGLAASVILNAKDRLASRFTSADGYNVTIYGVQADTRAIETQLKAQGISDFHSSVRLPVQVQTAAGAPIPGLSYLDGRAPADAAWDNKVIGGSFDATAGSVLLPAGVLEQGPKSDTPPIALKIGDLLTATTATGEKSMLRISGFYQAQESAKDNPPQGIIVGRDTVAALGSAGTSVIYVGHLPIGNLDSGTAALGQALPQTSVVSQNELNNARNKIFEGLFTFAIGMASLALLAGAILIANAVGLAMVERRREMGILKAVGFTGARVLGTLLIENALLGFIGGVLGMIGVGVAIIVINKLAPQAMLSLDPVLAFVMIAVAIALALISTTLVAWQPTRVRPLEVLRNE